MPADLRLEVGYRMTPLGPRDPTCRVERGRVCMAMRTEAGPVALELVHRGDSPHVDVRGWGPGAPELRADLPGMIGLEDDPSSFAPQGPLAELWKENAGMYLPRLPRVIVPVVQVVLLQLVRSKDAVNSWARFMAQHAEPAPGPLGLQLAPSADALKRMPYYTWLDVGVLPKQARTIARVAAEAKRIERSAALGSESLARRLGTIKGVGPWTIGYVCGMALGDPDAFLPGDYGLPSVATYVMENVELGTDADLERLLAPYAGHRYRVIRLLWASRKIPPRKGPRLARRHRPGHRRG